MITSTRFITVVMAVAAMAMLGTGPAAAESPGATMVPLAAVFRNCDAGPTRWVSATGFGSASALIRSTDSNVSAEVRLAIGQPNTSYGVRLIQVPRPASAPCNAGDPGVAAGALFTDANGTGAVTIQDSVRSGATGVWVFITGPPDPGQAIGAFYTSDVVTSLT